MIVGCRLKQTTGDDDYTKIFNHLPIGYQSGDSASHVTKNLTLPTEVTLDIEFESVSWTTSHPSIIQTNGIVNQPIDDTIVVLTLIVTIDGISKDRVSNLNVIGTGPIDVTYFTIIFDSTGGNDIDAQLIAEGEKIVEPASPIREGHTFDGWYKEFGLATKWNFQTDIPTSNLTLYAKWIETEDEDPVDEEGTLTFQDEFNDSTLDMSKWSYQNGSGAEYGIPFWGNQEKQYYKSQNIEVSGGTLKIHAKMEQTYDAPTNTTLDFTSGKIVTQGKFDQTFGRFEAKIKAPLGQGFWPAFWLMPANNTHGNGWPYNGEIDIMELRGRVDDKVSSAIHFFNGGGHEYQHGETTLPNQGKIDEFHVYAVDWVSNKLEFSVDGYVYHTREASWHNAPIPFNHDFYIIINLAVGGHFDNHLIPNANDFPAVLEVDYVRVYA